MQDIEREVQARMHAAQQERKAALDRHRVDTTFAVGNRVWLRTKELADGAEIGKLQPRWDGPFEVAAVAGPYTYTLSVAPCPPACAAAPRSTSSASTVIAISWDQIGRAHV